MAQTLHNPTLTAPRHSNRGAGMSGRTPSTDRKTGEIPHEPYYNQYRYIDNRY